VENLISAAGACLPPRWKLLLPNSLPTRSNPRRQPGGLVNDAGPETLRKLPSVVRLLATALSCQDRGPTLNAIVASGRIAPGLLSVTLRPEAIAERLGVPLAQISRDAL